MFIISAINLIIHLHRIKKKVFKSVAITATQINKCFGRIVYIIRSLRPGQPDPLGLTACSLALLPASDVVKSAIKHSGADGVLWMLGQY